MGLKLSKREWERLWTPHKPLEPATDAGAAQRIKPANVHAKIRFRGLDEWRRRRAREEAAK